MGLFDFLKPKNVALDEQQKLALELFPGGYNQVLSEAREMQPIANGLLTEDESRLLLTKAKHLIYTAKDKSFFRCKRYIIERSGNKLDDWLAMQVYLFICKKLSIQPFFYTINPGPVELPGSNRSNPIVIDKPNPVNLSKLRDLMREVSIAMRKHDLEIPVDSATLDSMASEQIKMSILKEMFGEEGKVWECGERLYLNNSVQSQEIKFKNSMTPMTLYFDFSRFGAF